MLLGDIVRLNAQKAPGRTALIVDDREISFGTLHERMLRLANALLGVASKGDRVGILAENVPEYVEAYYGVPTAGMALTFLNYRLNPKEWAWILNNAEARVLLVDRDYLPKIEPVLGDIGSIEHIIVIGGSGEGGLELVRRLRRRGAGHASLRSRSTRTTPRGSSTRAARPVSPRERCSPTATSWPRRSSR